MTAFALVLDGIVIVLLGVAIGFGVLLSRRLKALKQSGAEMQSKLVEFNEAAAKAEESLAELKAVAPEGGAASAVNPVDPEVMEKAEILRDDLMFLIERGEGLLKKAAAAPRPAPAAPVAASRSQEVGGALRRAVRAAAQPQSDGTGDTEPAPAGTGDPYRRTS